VSLWRRILDFRGLGFWAPQPLRLIALDATGSAELSRLHAFGGFARGWSSAECEALLTDRVVTADALAGGGKAGRRIDLAAAILSRRAADEAEVLVILVDPSRRRCGLGHRLLQAHAANLVRQGVRTLFLEVEEGNAAARALYAKNGFVTAGSRKGYYALPGGGTATALILRCDLDGSSGG
jgi:[ribosomal protein S18]-alanine N-acetyltransferase